MNTTNHSSARARAALWDVDGTLIDSSEYHWLSWRAALTAESYPLTRAQFASTFGQRNDEILRGLFGEEYPARDIERVAEAKETLYRKFIREGGVELLPGVRRWLDRLKGEGWRQAMASSAPRLNLEAILDSLDLRGYFDAIVSAEDVTAGKPDPQVFLIAASKLGIHPSRCVVVEDAPAGTEAARRAGMRSIGVLTSRESLEADVVVRTLDDLGEGAFDDLLSGL